MNSPVTYVLADPFQAPDEWTFQSVRMANAAQLFGVCRECGAVAKDYGVDHAETWHLVLDHEDGCRASDDTILEHLDEIGVEVKWQPIFVTFTRRPR